MSRHFQSPPFDRCEGTDDGGELQKQAQFAPPRRNYDELFAEFWPLYERRPIRNNLGGSELPHLFALWVYLRETRPTHVIESGVWKGQTTWLIETALPDAHILAIDPSPHRREWTSPRATYSRIDFGFQDLGTFPLNTTLVFFDDHVHAWLRLTQVRAWGFRHVVFDDNYPDGVGDPSIRQLLRGTPAGRPSGLKNRLRHRLRRIVSRYDMIQLEIYDPQALRNALLRLPVDYSEFPPLTLRERTRWGTRWRDSFGDVAPCLDPAKLTDGQRDEIERTSWAYTAMCRLTFGSVNPARRFSGDAKQAVPRTQSKTNPI